MTVSVYVTVAPGAGLAGEADLSISRSAPDSTSVVVVVSLSSGSGSGVVEVTSALLTSVPTVAAPTRTTISRLALAPGARVPTVQVTVPAALAQPASALEKVTPAGSVSTIWAFCALLGPAFVMVTV